MALIFFVHIYVFWNMTPAPFKVTKMAAFGSTVGTTIVSLILFYLRVPNYQPCRIVFYFFMLWFGFLLMAFMSSFVFQVLHLLGAISDKAKPALIVVSTLLLFTYSLINASVIHVLPRTIYLKGHPLNATIRIAHLTDLHLGSAYRRSFTERICNKLKEIDPDLVVITGDLFDGNVKFEYDLIEPFDHLSMPVYFVTGNHDMIYPEEITEVINRSKMIRLKDSATIFNDIQLLGFDHEFPAPNIYTKVSAIDLKPNKVNVLLYHAPDYDVDILSELNIAVHLAGHTHGGQVFPMNLYMMLTSDYVSGLYHSEDYNSHIYVCQGIGATKAQIRLGTKPTISLITLCNEDS